METRGDDEGGRRETADDEDGKDGEEIKEWNRRRAPRGREKV
jgi:hypothetical protein